MSAAAAAVLAAAVLSSVTMPAKPQTPPPSDAAAPAAPKAPRVSLPAPPPALPTSSSAVRQIPPPGIAVPEADRAELRAGLDALGKQIDDLRDSLKKKPELLRYLPDVQIYQVAVQRALDWNEFYKGRSDQYAEIKTAKSFLEQGKARADALKAGSAPWTTQTGLVVFGYVSRIDGSVQPYGLVVPKEWATTDKSPRHLWIFCHGRGETTTEISFINGHQHGAGDFTPPGTFVLHPYGRFCNANRYAGEIDVLEAQADVESRYPIDKDRVAMTGFSMGGASSWQFATHYADRWAAASPGAGFTDTADYTKAYAPGKTPPPWYEVKLWQWYDPVDYAVNLAQCSTIGYSGEIDPQKRAADLMEAAMQKEGLTLTRAIGPHTGHAYERGAKQQVIQFIEDALAKGRDTKPAHIRFTTFTLRYPHMDWLAVEGLEKHWDRARVDATLTDPDKRTVTATTQNVTRLWLDPHVLGGLAVATLDGQKPLTGSLFEKVNGTWRVTSERAVRDEGLLKVPGLQGPIDDAFMGRFVMVRPTGTPQNPATGAWVNEELAHAQHLWQIMFRGDAPTKDDRDVSKEDIADCNLVLWGDPSSNRVLAKIADKLPIRWNPDGSVTANGKTYPSGTSVPVLIYPNPLNPLHYVVVNSGITWREAHVLSNAYQTPKLPDWAVLDISTPPDKTRAGKVLDAGFFDERWRFQPGS